MKTTKCSRGEITSCRGEPRRRSDEWPSWVLKKGYYISKASWGGGEGVRGPQGAKAVRLIESTVGPEMPGDRTAM